MNIRLLAFLMFFSGLSAMEPHEIRLHCEPHNVISACAKGDRDTIVYYQKHQHGDLNAIVSSDGKNLLHMAQDPVTIRTLLCLGVPVVPDFTGQTPVHYAAIADNYNRIRAFPDEALLIPDNDNALPLHYSVAWGSLHAFMALLGDRASDICINQMRACDKLGQTPLQLFDQAPYFVGYEETILDILAYLESDEGIRVNLVPHGQNLINFIRTMQRTGRK